MRITEVDQPVSQVQIDALEKALDRVFAQVGIDVEFTRHFLDRVNDERNGKQITLSELGQLFKKEFIKFGKPIAQLGPDAQAVMKDMSSDINIPFALDWNSQTGMLELIAKTVMRKKNFSTPNKEFAVERQLKEGGNVFKTADNALTQRIGTPQVRPTVDFIEKITGLDFVDDDLLGTTGKKVDADGSFEKNSSGDLDLNTDANKISKEQLIAKLTVWLKSQGVADADIMNVGKKKTDGWIKDAGDQVHFRTPIQGSQGYVQTDFMFTNDPNYQRGAKRGGTENYGGKHRAILLSSIARGRGYKFSPKFGLVDPEQGDKVIANTWDKIAVLLLGKGAKEEDTHTVESMIAFLKNDPDYEQLVASAKETFARDGLELP